MKTLTVLLAILECGGAAAAFGQPAQSGGSAAALQSVVILPFDNFSGEDEAARNIAALVAKSITARGWRVVESDAVEPLLEKERVRYLDSLEPAMLETIARTAGASAVVSGTVYTVTTGRIPVVALSARMVRADGTPLWGDVAGLSADDTEQLLGFGRKTTADGVAADAVKALMRYFPAGDKASLVRGKRKPLFRGGPLAYRADKQPLPSRRVCVLPFDNTAALPESARVIADILALRIAAAGSFEVVEPATLRAAALKAGIASFRGITTDDLARLAPVVGTPLFLRGTIYTYTDASVHLELSMLDVSAKRLVWSAQHARESNDYTGLLMRGATTNAVALADRVIAEMVDTSEGKKR